MEMTHTNRIAELETLLRRTKEGLSSSQLARLLGVDETTIRRDLRRLGEQTDIGLIKRGRRYIIGFHRATRSLRLTADEVLALYLACRLLSRQQGDRNPHTESVMEKLADAVRDDAPHLADAIKNASTLQRRLPIRTGYLAVLETLTQAWSEGQVVQMAYRNRGGGLTERRFHPYAIEPYGATNSCYTIGFDELHHEVRTFKVDRIISATLAGERFTIPPDFDSSRLFSQAWGVVWRDVPPQTVELRFCGESANAIQEAFWHPSQRIFPLVDGTCRVTFQVCEPREMLTWIRQWGAEVEVLSPQVLRDEIAAAAVVTAQRYAEG
jgi:predicted DNA-binding transcriptional regulator YafY